MKIGLLPLYIELYDEVVPFLRPRLGEFYGKVAELLRGRGFEVAETGFCRLAPEFDAAVRGFEDAGADAVVTLHMAYSPSLECVGALTDTELPVIVFDTTETRDFSSGQSDAEINYCHGIHGVMDMTNLLRRAGKPYAIAAGWYGDDKVVDKLCGLIRAAVGAKSLRGSKTGNIGGAFDGMGDFLVSPADMAKKFGVTVIEAGKAELLELYNSVPDEEVERELCADRVRFGEINPVSREVLAMTERTGLAVRAWAKKHSLDAYTVNFRTVTGVGLPTMPFMECCKAMESGVGYAGEGDTLTASVNGALTRAFGADKVSFVEIFCPDWAGNRLMISHMGEMNYAVAARAPEMSEIEFTFGPGAKNPVVAYACYKPGRAVFVNVSDGGDGKYNMLIAPVEMEDETTANFRNDVRGWMRPPLPVGEFLETISACGVTHHSGLVYDTDVRAIEHFARVAGFKPIVIG